MTQGTVSTTIAALAMTISAVALYFLVIQIRLLRQQVDRAQTQYATEHAAARRRATLEFLSSTLESRIGFIRDIPSLRDEAGVKEFLQRVSEDESTERLLIAFLSCYEYIAAGVNVGALDEETVHRTIGRTLVLSDTVFKGYTEGRRKREGHPSLYRELERTAEQLRECEDRQHHPR